jgi:hypothetical protein
VEAGRNILRRDVFVALGAESVGQQAGSAAKACSAPLHGYGFSHRRALDGRGKPARGARAPH